MAKNLTIFSERNCGFRKKEIHNLVQKLKEELEFSISSLQINFVSSDTILNLNKKYLEHNFTTDIITFNYSGENNNLDGEIFISVVDAEKNALKFKVDCRTEILRLVIHGILHLLGYNDDRTANRRIMKIMEDKLTNKFNFIL